VEVIGYDRLPALTGVPIRFFSATFAAGCQLGPLAEFRGVGVAVWCWCRVANSPSAHRHLGLNQPARERRFIVPRLATLCRWENSGASFATD
jgi:hypothetical protein